MKIKEDLERLIDILPKSIPQTFYKHPEKILVELMDLGRRPELDLPIRRFIYKANNLARFRLFCSDYEV